MARKKKSRYDDALKFMRETAPYYVKIRELIKKDKDFGDDMEIMDLCKMMKYYTSSQVYGPRLEKKIINALGARKVPNENHGDMKWKSRTYEVKASISAEKVATYHFVQIRSFQNVGYVFLAVDIIEDTVQFFKLTRSQMIREVERLGSTAHGKDDGTNKQQEHRITIKKNTKHYDRWLAKYQMDTSELDKGFFSGSPQKMKNDGLFSWD